MDQICEGENTSGEALEQPEGILQLIDKLETIVDQMCVDALKDYKILKIIA